MAEERVGRRERERRRHRAEMIGAAERVFAREGYQGATIEHIAEAADFSVGTLYNFFGSKEELFGEVVSAVSEEVFASMKERVFEEKDPAKALDALIELRLLFPQEHREFAGMFFDMAPSAPGAFAQTLPESCRHMYEQYMDAVLDLVRRGTAAGVFREREPLYLALCLEGALRTVSIYWVVNDPGDTAPASLATVRAALKNMICTAGGTGEETGQR